MSSIHGGSGTESDEPWSCLQAAAEALSDKDVVGWSDGQVRAGLRALLVEARRLDAIVATVVASFDARGLSEADGFRTARSWLIAFGRMSQGAATGWLSRGRLQRQLPALAAAARGGQVSAEQLRRVSDLVEHIGIDAVREADEILASVAGEFGPGEVQTACHRIRAHVDPDGPDPDPDAAQRRGLSISRVGSLFNVSGRLDAEGGATVLTALDALMRPPTAEDPRTPQQRRADAMVELARQALAGGTLPTVGGVRPQLGLLLTPEALLGLSATAPTTSTAAAGPAGSGLSSERPRSAATSERATREDVASSGPGAHASAASARPPGLPPPDRLECAGVPLLAELPWN